MSCGLASLAGHRCNINTETRWPTLEKSSSTTSSTSRTPRSASTCSSCFRRLRSCCWDGERNEVDLLEWHLSDCLYLCWIHDLVVAAHPALAPAGSPVAARAVCFHRHGSTQ